MKKILLYTFLVFMLSFVSCDEELIEITNPNAPTTDTFWKTPEDAQIGMNAVYNMFYKPGTWTRWIYFRYDLTSDEAYSQSPWNELKEWTRFIYFNYNFWEGNSILWRDHYKAILRCNQVLSYVPEIEFENPNEKVEILAQAKFLRAFYYYNLALMFDNVPMVLEVSKPDDTPEQINADAVLAQVKQDLQDAVNGLPEQWGDSQIGRPTKGAALALLGKVHMQLHEWQEAKDALAWLVNGAGSQYYDLVTDYKDNFKHTTENNIESVFEIQFSDINSNGDGDQPNPNVGTNRAQFFAPRGIGWSDGQPRRWLVDEYKKELTTDGQIDPRLRANIFYPELQSDYPGEKIYGRDWDTGWGNDCFFRKYQGDYYRDREDYYSPINFRVIRYADVLLCYAECLAELEGGAPPVEAIEAVNKVRQRVGLGELQNSSLYSSVVNSKTDFLKRLQMERSLELCYEGVRWADLKRWNLWDTQAGMDELISRDPDFTNFVVGKSNRLPIPQSDVDNNPNLDQNPMY
ncbi:MAG: RagB/SusD family nutrient uptake outer membrane protein [Bacteroidales bacterium]|nr:MAG: RagB/SusD family nutrient uptake outer membrane protein [Bacteroidales bacterium]